MQAVVNPREERGKAIAASQNQVFRVTDDHYQVASQSGRGYYEVNNTEIGWKCNCPDHKYRGAKCKHIWAVAISFGLRKQAKKNVVLDLITITACPYCGSQDFKKSGVRHNKSGDIQVMLARLALSSLALT